jgi:hypothetical protein
VRFQSELAIHLVKPIFLTLRNLLTAPAKKKRQFRNPFHLTGFETARQ